MSDESTKNAEPPPRYTLEENPDGSAVVRLLRAVKYDGEPHDRLFIPQITGRHMKKATWHYGQDITVGQLVDFAGHIVQPVGILDDLEATLARDIAVEVVKLLGKYQMTGTSASPPSG